MRGPVEALSRHRHGDDHHQSGQVWTPPFLKTCTLLLRSPRRLLVRLRWTVRNRASKVVFTGVKGDFYALVVIPSIHTPCYLLKITHRGQKIVTIQTQGTPPALPPSLSHTHTSELCLEGDNVLHMQAAPCPGLRGAAGYPRCRGRRRAGSH